MRVAAGDNFVQQHVGRFEHTAHASPSSKTEIRGVTRYIRRCRVSLLVRRHWVLLQHARTPPATSAEATGFRRRCYTLAVGTPAQQRSLGRIVDMHEAVDALAFTENRNLRLHQCRARA
jgi:hypothetical protein